MNALTNVRVLEFIEAIAAAMASLRLLQLGLWRSQWALLAWAAFTACALVAEGCFAPASAAYFDVFIASTAGFCLLSIVAVVQMFALALENYAGLQTTFRWAILTASFLSTAISMLATRATWNGGPAGRNAALFFVESFDRAIVLTLVLFIALFLALLSRYPLNLSPNTRLSCSVFGAIFLSEAVSTLIDNVSPALYAETVDAAQIVFAALAFAVWSLFLRRESQTFNPPPSTLDENTVLRELNSLNALLSRSGRK